MVWQWLALQQVKILNTNTCDNVDDDEVVALVNDYTTPILITNDDKTTPPPTVDNNAYTMSDATTIMSQWQFSNTNERWKHVAQTPPKQHHRDKCAPTMSPMVKKRISQTLWMSNYNKTPTSNVHPSQNIDLTKQTNFKKHKAFLKWKGVVLFFIFLFIGY